MDEVSEWFQDDGTAIRLEPGVGVVHVTVTGAWGKSGTDLSPAVSEAVAAALIKAQGKARVNLAKAVQTRSAPGRTWND
jgi:hypothetical protein